MNVKSMFIIAGCIYAFMVFTGRMSVSDMTDWAGGGGRESSSSSSRSSFFEPREQHHYSTFGPTKRMSDYQPWHGEGREDRMPSW